MGEAFLYGNGGSGFAGLNFKIFGGTSAPASPVENTIWVSTDQKITSWIFAINQPTEPKEGMVWLKTSTTGVMELNAIKKNGIYIFPISAMQYTNGAWAEKTAKSYQNGEWAYWILYLYNSGDTCDNVTGGYTTVSALDGEYSSGTTATMNATNIYVTAQNNRSGGGAMCGKSTENKIDLSNVKTLYATGNCSNARYDPNGVGVSGVGILIRDTKTMSEGGAAASQFIGATGDFNIAIDVAELTGSYYVICYAKQQTGAGYSGRYPGTGTFTKIWCE